MAVTTETSAATTAIRPFTVEISEADVEDLRARIAATRFPEREPSKNRSCIRWETPSRRRASQLATMQALVRYWGTEYDLRRVEARLNALPQFLTEIDDLDIHFIHVRSRHENALPVILIHGWPGSVVEMLNVVGPLTDPTAHGGSAEDAFDVVIPSIPGYGFSGKPTTSGWGPDRVASASVELMKRLGYTRFVAQGGDWGAVIVDLMGVQAPPELLGIHTNMPGVLPPEIAQPVRAGGRPAGAGRALRRRAALLRAGQPTCMRRGSATASRWLLHPQTLLRDRGLARRPGRLDARPRRPELPGHHQRLRRRAAPSAT